jgi:uncharacterized membrane protein YhaH (DUF805 family)
MQALRFLFSSSGRLAPRAFIFAALAVYVAGAAAQGLTAPNILAHAGLWPFAAAQAVLIWIWYALHARRLHDADLSASLAAGAAVLYALSIVLLLTLATGFFATSAAGTADPNATGALALILLASVIAALAQSGSHDIGWFIVTALVALAFLPMIVALAVTLWAATRPRAAEQRP